jgi:hypothetical protein
MAKYFYKVELSRAVTIEERRKAKDELQRLFGSAELPVGEGLTFEVTTPLEPLAAQTALAQFAVTYGSAAITVGGKIE